MNYYQKQIARYTTKDPVHVLAWMMDDRATLDGLSEEEFRRAVLSASKMVRSYGPVLSQRLADSMGIK